MEVIENRGWFVSGNKIAASLMRFYVEINYNEYYSTLTVVDSNMSYLYLNFANLENAFNFTENEVNNSYSLAEVEDRFHGFNKQLRKLKTKKLRK